MHTFIARLKVILSAAVTYLTIAGVVINAVIAEIGDDVPRLATLAARLLVGIGVAIAIIRRVTPVLEHDRGILPPFKAQP